MSVRKMKNIVDKTKQGRNCSVCGDNAVGFNFGAITCESCKAFFRRNALKQSIAPCVFDHRCSIQLTTRRFCPHCRLQKCFTVGMKSRFILDEDAKRERLQKIQSNRQKRAFKSQRSDITGAKSMPQMAASAIASNHSCKDCNSESGDASGLPFSFEGTELTRHSDSVSDISPAMPNSVCTLDTPANHWTDLVLSQTSVPVKLPQDPQIDRTGSTKDGLHPSLRHCVTRVPSYSPQQCAPSPSTATTTTTDTATASTPTLSSSNYPSNGPPQPASVEPQHVDLLVGDKQIIEPQESSATQGDIGVRNVLDGHVWTTAPAPHSNGEFITLNKRLLANNMVRLLSQCQWSAVNNLRSAYETSFVEADTDEAPKGSNLTLSSLVNSSSFLVRKLINFAKKLADFSALNQESQICLLKGVVLSTLFLMSASHYNVENDVWMTPKGNIPTEILRVATGVDSFYQEHIDYCRSFRGLVSCDPNLMPLMQVLCLFSPDRPCLKARLSVSNIHDRYILLLKHYLEAKHGFSKGRALLATVLGNLCDLDILTQKYGHILMQVDPTKVDPLLLEVFNLSLPVQSTSASMTPLYDTETIDINRKQILQEHEKCEEGC